MATDDKETYGPLGSLSPAPVARAWRSATLAPIGSAAAWAALTGLSAYYAAPWLLKKMYNSTAHLLPDAARRDWEESMQPENLNTTARSAALGVGGAAALLSLAHNWNPDYPTRSLFKWNYAEDDKETAP